MCPSDIQSTTRLTKTFFSVKKGAGEEEKECREKRENVDKKSAQATRQIDSRTLAL